MLTMRENSENTYEPRLERAVRLLASGGVIAYPTEAVYGFGCLPGERKAVERLLHIKRRSWRKGLILIAADLAQLSSLILLPNSGLRDEILASWPGPVTWILDAQPGVPAWLGGGRGTLAVRVTAHPLARRLCSRLRSPLISTSANRSGRPPLTRALQVRREFGAELDEVLVGPLGSLQSPTTLRDGRSGRILR
jgi:L-threonylcarbamoyladenylate synthase